MHQWLLQLAANHGLIIYVAILFVAIAEGPIISILGGIFAHLGYVHLIPILLTVMAGDLVGDILWYGLGAKYGTGFVGRFGRFFGITPENIESISGIFHRHKYTILIISKLTTGLGFAPVVLFTAGMSNVPFGRYMAINAIGQLVWSSMLLAVGFYFGRFYSFLDNGFEKLTLVAGAIIVVFLISRYCVYLRKRLI
jgi:membrane-associated protein